MDMLFTGLDTSAEESEEKSISGSSSSSTISRIMLKPHSIFSISGRFSPLFFSVSFCALSAYASAARHTPTRYLSMKRMLRISSTRM